MVFCKCVCMCVCVSVSMDPFFVDVARRFQVLESDTHNSILVYVDGIKFPVAVSLNSIEHFRVFHSGGIGVEVLLSRYSTPDTAVSSVPATWFEPCPETGALPEELWPDTLRGGRP